MLSFADVPAEPDEYLPQGDRGRDSREQHPHLSTASAAPLDEEKVQSVIDYVESMGFTFAPWQVAAFITAARTKPFVILAGISGTGKTKLPQLVAEATGAEVVVVPVKPDWTDSSDLLGYERLDSTFVPGHLLRLCERAIAEPDRQFFLVLDEMNVARVEYYFAEVLSLMENRRLEAGAIRTDPLQPHAPDADGHDWPNVYLPENLCIVGTVNMDEATHGFSRKVLDRAFVLELSEVDLSDLPSKGLAPTAPTPWAIETWRSNAFSLSDVPPDAQPVVQSVIEALTSINEALAKAQLQVGYRVRDEVALFCINAIVAEAAFVDAEEAIVPPLDLSISMKILPRIQGGGALIRDVLEALRKWAVESERSNEGDQAAAGYPRTLARIDLMLDKLNRTGFTSYWI